MKPIIFSFFNADKTAASIIERCGFNLSDMVLHQFPDEETLPKINADVSEHSVIFIAALDRPNSKLLPLLFAAETVRDLGATDIILVAPYLPYMRQDKRFHPDEGLTSQYFAALLSNYFDWLVTINPHLHRWKALSDVYSIPSTVLHAESVIAEWIIKNISNPLIIGVGIESEQWMASMAKRCNAPYLTAQKVRSEDQMAIEVTIPKLAEYSEYTPVLVDDIIASAQTMIAAVKCVKKAKMQKPICIAVHGIFAGDAYNQLLKTGCEVVTCNTINHISNKIDMGPLLAGLLSGPLFDYT
jgi:ribose-phosphate pyrophosphokinase